MRVLNITTDVANKRESNSLLEIVLQLTFSRAMASCQLYSCSHYCHLCVPTCFIYKCVAFSLLVMHSRLLLVKAGTEPHCQSNSWHFYFHDLHAEEKLNLELLLFLPTSLLSYGVCEMRENKLNTSGLHLWYC